MSAPGRPRQVAWSPMPLTEDEWRGFVNEHNAMMADVEMDLHSTLEILRARFRALVESGVLRALEADSLRETLRETLLRAQWRLNAHSRRLARMREEGEL